MAVSYIRILTFVATTLAQILNSLYLGDLEEGLGNVNNAAHLLDVLNAGLDGLGVVSAGAVEDVLDLLVLSLGPLLVGRAAVLEQTSPDGQQADRNDSLLVHDVVLIAEGVDAKTGGTAEEGGLADQVVAGEGIDDALGLLLGLLGGDVAGVSDGSSRDRRGRSAGDGGSEEGSAYIGLQIAHLVSLRLRTNWDLGRQRNFCDGDSHTDSASYQARRHCEMVSDGVSRPCHINRIGSWE